MSSIVEREQASIFQTYRRLPLVIDHAEGVYIVSDNGTRYVDFLGGIAVNALGHTHPKIVDAVIAQIKRYMHVSNIFFQEPQVVLAERLKSMTGFDRVFFTNSGTEATEGALKIARRAGSTRGASKLIGFTSGFHGRTYGALSVMDKPLYKDGMGPFVSDTAILPYNDVQALIDGIDESVCGVIVECIQGEGGLTTASSEFIQTLFSLRDRFGFVIIADEIQTGIGRTGSFFAFDSYGVRPDVVTIAKSIGGGLPLGGILATEAAASVLDKGMHGTTYGGNAVACAAGIVVLDELENGLIDHIRSDVGPYLTAQLQQLITEFPDKATEVRGRGCIQGLALTSDAAPLVQELLSHGVIANATANTVLRLVPPYIITREHIDVLTEALRYALRS